MALADNTCDEGGTCGYAIDPHSPATWPEGVTVDPEAVSGDDLPTCQHEPLEDHDRCGLHLPLAERPPEFDATAAVADRLDTVGDVSVMTASEAGTASLVGVRLPSLDLQALTAQLSQNGLDTVDLRFASIRGPVVSKQLTISQQLKLDGARAGQIRAPGTTFEEPLSLSRCRIGEQDIRSRDIEPSAGALHLPNATIEKRLELDRAIVEGDATLSEMDTLNRLLASDATVEGVLSLDGTQIATQATLTAVTCGQLSATRATFKGVNLTGIQVRGPARFDHADLYGVSDDDQVKLTNGIFEGPLTFDHAIFHTTANLRNLTADSKFRAADTEFRGPVEANNSTVHGSLEAPHSTFQETLNCSDSQFNAEVTFDGATFDETARFTDAAFAGEATFTNARFTGRAAFNSATFATDCSFRATTHDEPASTRAATTRNSDRASEAEVASDGGATAATESPGVFQGDASFNGATIGGRGDFRLLETAATERTVATAETVLETDELTVAGDFEAADARFASADLAGFTAGGTILLSGADLSEADLRRADLAGAQIEQARLSHANLFAADFQKAYLHGTVFEGTRMDNQTAFGRRVVYHDQATTATDNATELDWLEKAISLYSQLETLARENGQSPTARRLFVSRKDAQRDRILLTDTDRSLPLVDWTIRGESRLGGLLDRGDHLLASLKRTVMRYGESYLRVVGTSVAIIVFFGGIFPLSRLHHTTAGSIQYQFPLTLANLKPFLFGLLYSLSSFTALGVAGFQPGPAAEGMAVFEAGIGIVMFGLLLFVLQRRTVR